MKLWWDAWPGRLEYEEAALRREGIVAERDMEAFARGFVRLHLRLPHGYWMTQWLRADFPDSFPSIRPEVYAPDLTLKHHQNPIGKNLCLLERSTDNWSPSWTLARLLGEQLPQLSQAHTLSDRDKLLNVEVAQGEPLTEFLPYEPESVIMIDSAWRAPLGALGLFELTLTSGTTAPLRAFVSTLTDVDANLIANGNFGLPQGEPLIGAWISLTERPTVLDASALLRSVRDRHPQLRRAPNNAGIEIIGVVFPDELGHRSEGLSWAFIAHREEPLKRGARQVSTSFVRAARAGIDDLAARYPAFRLLQRGGVAIFGLGCLGALSALELARAGVGRLHVLDHDLVEPGTVVRWPFGLAAAGKSKAKIIRDTIVRDYPWVTIVGSSHQIGRADQQPPEREVIELILRDVDVVYDATAEIGIQQLLSTVARERNLTYICISATPGGRGGVIARFNHRPESGCWSCFLQAMMDGRIPTPEADDSPGIQPAGCNRLTYAGANFDISEVALQGVRLATATLLVRQGVTTADYEWDVAVVNLTDAKGRRRVPSWSTHQIPVSERCQTCKTP